MAVEVSHRERSLERAVAPSPAAEENPPAAPFPVPAGPSAPEAGPEVGPVGDPAEVDADRRADDALAHLRRTGAPPGSGAVVGPEGGPVPAETAQHIERLRPSGAPLPGATRGRMEEAFGASFDHVRVHVGAEPARLNRAVSARAFTTGSDIFFGRGEFAPDTPSGERVLAHELAHTLQDGGGARRQPSTLRRVASTYQSDEDLRKLTLSAFDAYARGQADWASSELLVGDKESLRSLLALARAEEGRVLAACGRFTVEALLARGIGNGTVDAALSAYSRSASATQDPETVWIQTPATSVGDAIAWGAAILELARTIDGRTLYRCVLQGPENGLKTLVDAGAVADFVTYVAAVKPLLDATTGSEVTSFLAFRGEGGMGKYAGYLTDLPEVRNHHRFTVAQLDRLVANRRQLATNKALPHPLPISVVLQSAYDHNGAFHRDAPLTAVISRTTHVTVVVEGEPFLVRYGDALKRFAADGRDGKVEEVLLAGHGDARLIEMAGDKRLDVLAHGDEPPEHIRVDGEPSSFDRMVTEDFFDDILKVLRNDDSARIVLNACLTASNSVDLPLSADPTVATEEIRTAIHDYPSLATSITTRLGAHRARVLGANGSFPTVGLLDAGGGIDLTSAEDPQLTASKLEYVERGLDPQGVLRATLESWATNRPDTIAAVRRRIAATATDTAWKPKVVHTLFSLIAAKPDDAAQISALVVSAHALGGLTLADHCSVAKVAGKIPDASLETVLTGLSAAAAWTDPATRGVPAVLLQLWLVKNGAKRAAFLAFLDGSTFTTVEAVALLDLVRLTPQVKELLPVPAPPPAPPPPPPPPTLGTVPIPMTPPPPAIASPPPRGRFLLALTFLVALGAGAPEQAKRYVRSVCGLRATDFPAESNVDDLLRGATRRQVLAHAGLGGLPTVTGGSGPVRPVPNVDPDHSGTNTVVVEPVSLRRRVPDGDGVRAYTMPSGDPVGTVPGGTALVVLGRTRGILKGTSTVPDTDYLAVERKIGGHFTVFVRESEVIVP
ncbi:DUF4157 domain-containing protein [Nocardioides sp. W7]|uniref:eCIS core domain-containing protein n=1 Tax=Nocardioides sp. W7 TaxID=2931390 RepID=UPI00246899CB|nr:DUF4157 domain-containing protein [Nocardioides sp. W7]